MSNESLSEARGQLTDVIEEVAAVSMHLREAIRFNNAESSIASVEDAQNAIEEAVKQLGDIFDKIGRWAIVTGTEVAQ